ncbi:hypothetical protein [Rubellicoccus peritrichatus]|uniref:PEP-CTERM protein-sorting domain-containing protein n=1 Tax=Rubellicoccus peritrichatus TaxID=3080537 RepID=A0AAQ3QVM5_9BACT|nr:hypothetical protein [Puniceicoccus sp. CR14]WOO41778.1 hypothetical protein RZN69_01660 [Puniceicoccus sp. CR14]
MTNSIRFYTITAIIAALAYAPASQAVILLNVDLSVVNHATVIATAGASEATVSGNDTLGAYLEGFFSSPGTSISFFTSGDGDFTNTLNPADGNTGMFRGNDGLDLGLNVFGWSTDGTVDFSAGTQAFTGSVTWRLSSAIYNELLVGPPSGNLYFPADSSDDLPGATLIGQWSRVAVPEPSNWVAIIGSVTLLGLVGYRRFRGSKSVVGPTE